MSLTDQPMNLKTMAAATSEELRELSQIAIKLQDIFANLNQGGIAASGDLSQIQGLDYLTQSLIELSGFWETVSLETPDQWQYENRHATQNIKLRDLANRLSGLVHDDSNQQHPVLVAGACELF